MTTDPPKPPRPPRTGVGVEIVEAILTAAEAVIDEDGMAQFTTNRVAARAGVSIGSLYQYFPNKAAVLAELARRLELRTRAQLGEILHEARTVPVEKTATLVVDAMLYGIGGLGFRRTLLQEVPSSWKDDTSSAVDAEMRAHVETVISDRDDVRPGDRGLMAWVIAHAIEGVVEVTVRTAPEMIGSPGFRTELIELVRRYLEA